MAASSGESRDAVFSHPPTRPRNRATRPSRNHSRIRIANQSRKQSHFWFLSALSSCSCSPGSTHSVPRRASRSPAKESRRANVSYANPTPLQPRAVTGGAFLFPKEGLEGSLAVRLARASSASSASCLFRGGFGAGSTNRRLTGGDCFCVSKPEKRKIDGVALVFALSHFDVAALVGGDGFVCTGGVLVHRRLGRA